jgi:phosphate transport system substrate-binding protein
MSFKVPPFFIIAALGVGGYFGYNYFTHQGSHPSQNFPNPAAQTSARPDDSGTANNGSGNPGQNYPTAQNGTIANSPFNVKLQGSTSMVVLYRDFAANVPSGSKIDWQATSSDKGIEAVQKGTITLAGSSRVLTNDEQNGQPRLASVHVATDEVAVIVGKSNKFGGNLTKQQVRDIFSGKIKNWSAVGGPNKPIRVINRAEGSGTRDFFEKVVMKGETFSPSATTMQRDETTGIIRILGDDGISYATYSQVALQELSTKSLPLDGVYPGTSNKGYALSRELFFVYLADSTSEDVKAFIAFVTGPVGQRIVQNSGFSPAH